MRGPQSTRLALTTSCRSVYEYPLAGLCPCTGNKSRITRRHRHVQSGRRIKSHRLWHLDHRAPIDLDLFGVRTLTGTKDARLARYELATFRDGRVGRDDAAEFGARDPREGRLELVLALNLENWRGAVGFKARSVRFPVPKDQVFGTHCQRLWEGVTGSVFAAMCSMRVCAHSSTQHSARR